MPWKKDGTYVPVPDDRTFNGKRFSLLWVTGFSSKRRAEQTKNALKEGGSKPYNVRIVPYEILRSDPNWDKYPRIDAGLVPGRWVVWKPVALK